MALRGILRRLAFRRHRVRLPASQPLDFPRRRERANVFRALRRNGERQLPAFAARPVCPGRPRGPLGSSRFARCYGHPARIQFHRESLGAASAAPRNMIAGSIAALAPQPPPAWFPPETVLAQMLAQHQPVYRWRKPRYAVRLLRDLALLLPERNCRLLDIGGGSGLIAEAIARYFPGKSVTAIDVVDRFLPSLTIEHKTFDGRT